MRKDTTTEADIVRFRQDLWTKIRNRVQEAIEVVLDGELEEALGCRSHERTEARLGYRNGAESRLVTTELGARTLRVPRARLRREAGTTGEFHSEVLPRYARRTKVVDEMLLGAYCVFR